ncbi:host specificity factor TipJ family phage tail protein [Acinetobacter gerneri]|uniref:host specificity factor TipJ family phage tail protein n=1 Tax=Acinetobacter gerneri TaxID=202952 RepID=UPI002935E9E3|nr:host specificity factor TipJ family phage tail protein [Acinetobacter gerneri]MDV2440702.1 host specificity factor TipJ family phage tail protein [Acinetobacter gerneri]
MSRLRILKNPLDASEEVLHIRTDDVLKVFKEVKKIHPQARIFLRPACHQNDVTPTNKIDEASLQMLSKNNDFDVVCQAGEAATIIAIASTVLSLAMSVYSYMNMPKTQSGVERGSSNNKLGNRENEQRLGERIPDIYGTVLAVPDLIAPPLRYFKNNVEIEETLMCLGRGFYSISDVREGETSIQQIDGESVSIYDPNQNLTDSNPMYRYGDVLTHPPRIGKQSKSITGQTLLNPSSARVVSTDISFTYPNIINITTDKFKSGETITIEGAQYGIKDLIVSGTVDVGLDNVLTLATATNISNPEKFKGLTIQSLLATDESGTLDLSGFYEVSNIIKSGSVNAWIYEITLQNPASSNQNFGMLTDSVSGSLSGLLTNNIDSMNLNGEYTINVVDDSKITLSAPDSENPEWLKLQNWGSTAGNTIGLYGSQENWLGWYKTENESKKVIANFYAPQGLYHIGTKGYKEVIGVELELQCQALDHFGKPTGEIYTVKQALFGDIKGIANSVGLTLECDLPNPSKLQYRMRRITVHTSKGTVVDEVQARSVFTEMNLEKLSYDDVTLVRTLTVTNDISSGVSKRQLNLIATRMVYSYITGAKSTERIATSNFADIVCDMTVDSYIGRRELDNLDLENLYATSQDITDYFGTSKATEFNYTLDQSNQSYEESLAQVASVVFCDARRESGRIYFQFEKLNPSSAILFNHRNKRPFSETWTIRGTRDKTYDGIEAKWKDPTENWVEKTIKLPNDSITNPKKIDLNGVTNKYQAHFLANRAWNKIKYQRKTVKFTGYGESDLVSRNNRIAVTNDTRPSIVPLGEDGKFTSGEIENIVGQTITVSQPVQLLPDQTYTIHLQLTNKSVETMRVTQGSDAFTLILERLPILPLITQFDGKVVSTTYSITLEQNKDSEAMLITEKSDAGQFESEITAINYDARYYDNDKDFINNLI